MERSCAPVTQGDSLLSFPWVVGHSIGAGAPAGRPFCAVWGRSGDAKSLKMRPRRIAGAMGICRDGADAKRSVGSKRVEGARIFRSRT
jgi:hypothetical protein